jgi:hypothetical protein
LQAQHAECARAEQQVRAAFAGLDTGSAQVRNGARLFSRVAMVLHGLDGLPALRDRVAAQALGAPEATAAYVKLVAGLLAVVFEAADTASDPPSRAPAGDVQLHAGQGVRRPRARVGGNAFAAGGIDAAGQQQWHHLIDSQQACFQVFADFSDARGAARRPGEPRPAGAGRSGTPAPHRLQRPARDRWTAT